MKILDDYLFDVIEREAKASPRHRMNYDLRTTAYLDIPEMPLDNVFVLWSM